MFASKQQDQLPIMSDRRDNNKFTYKITKHKRREELIDACPESESPTKGRPPPQRIPKRFKGTENIAPKENIPKPITPGKAKEPLVSKL